MKQKTLYEEKNLEQDQYLRSIITTIDDLENRSRLNNIRVRGLPEATGTEDLISILQGIFNTPLKRPETAEIVIDRAHRTLGPINADPMKSRDDFFHIKERIMRHVYKRL